APPQLQDRVVLVVSELVTNVIVHAGTPFVLCIHRTCAAGSLLLSVTDGSPLRGRGRGGLVSASWRAGCQWLAVACGGGGSSAPAPSPPATASTSSIGSPATTSSSEAPASGPVPAKSGGMCHDDQTELACRSSGILTGGIRRMTGAMTTMPLHEVLQRRFGVD